MILTTSQRALLYLYKTAGRDGVSCFDVGNAVWPDRVIRGGRGVSSNGGGDYAAQMMLGRLKKDGLVEYASSEGSTRWRLSAEGRRTVHKMSFGQGYSLDVPASPAEEGVEGVNPCTCGHAPEEHGHDSKYPGSTSCTECACISYEADPDAAEEPSARRTSRTRTLAEEEARMKTIDVSKKHKVTLTFLLDEEVTPQLFAQKIALACSGGALRPGEAVMVEHAKIAIVIGASKLSLSTLKKSKTAKRVKRGRA